MDLIYGVVIGIAGGLFFGIVIVNTYYANNYDALKYNLLKITSQKKIESLKLQLSMREFENEMLYRKILDDDNKMENKDDWE